MRAKHRGHGNRGGPNRRRGRPRGVVALVAAAFTVAAVVATEGEAGASCVAPSVTVQPSEVGRGQRVVVSGSGWGTDCYDTGPPPAGEGDLGTPASGLELVIEQGDRAWVLATGGAEDDYSFTATVTMPADLMPGDAWLSARKRGTRPLHDIVPNLSITSAPPVPSDAPDTATFGPSVPDASSDEATTDQPSRATAADERASDRSSGPDGDAARWSLVTVIAVVVPVLVAVAAVVRRRRSTPA